MKERPTRPKPTVEVRPARPKTVLLTSKEEDELADYITELQKIILRLTINDVMILANQLAAKYNKKIKFRNNVIMAERCWVLDLMKRYPKIILRIPDINTKPGGFNMAELDYFYKTLSDVYDVKKIPPDRIYATDYINIFIGENTSYVVDRKGNKENAISNGTIVKVKVCFNAVGQYIPSMMVSTQRHQSGLTNIEDAWNIVTPNGCLTNELFIQWLRRFIFITGAKKDNQVLLLFEGQPMYTKNIEIVKTTRDNGLNIMSYPPCTLNKLQPIDEMFVNYLSRSYEHVVTTWLHSNAENKLTKKHVADLFDKTLSAEAAAFAAIEAFQRCGIFPLNTNLFKESDFIPVINTELPIYKETSAPPTNTTQMLSTGKYYFDLYYNPRPGCSFWPDYA